MLSPVPDQEVPANVEEQRQNEAAYRQLLVHGVLALLLPTEDLENDCLTALVGQIFSEMILGEGIGGKASEPWMIWEGITKIAEVLQKQLPKSKAEKDVKTIEATMAALQSPPSQKIRSSQQMQDIGQSIQQWFFLVLQTLSLALFLLRFSIITIVTSSSLPSRYAHTSNGATSPLLDERNNSAKQTDATTANKLRSAPLKVPILEMKIWTCVSDLLDLESRMPWLNATISMFQWLAMTGPGELGDTNGMIDR